MRKNSFKCNNCNSAIPTELVEKYQFNVCPKCGHLYPNCIEILKNYFRIIQLSEKLAKATMLLFKSETTAAVREAIVILESTIRDKSELKDLIGADLIAKAFSFKTDSQTKNIIEEPKIKINDLSTITKRNEQDGIKFIAMGLMQGMRNIFMHSKGTEKLFYCIQVITTVDLLLKHIDGWAAIAD